LLARPAPHSRELTRLPPPFCLPTGTMDTDDDTRGPISAVLSHVSAALEGMYLGEGLLRAQTVPSNTRTGAREPQATLQALYSGRKRYLENMPVVAEVARWAAHPCTACTWQYRTGQDWGPTASSAPRHGSPRYVLFPCSGPHWPPQRAEAPTPNCQPLRTPTRTRTREPIEESGLLSPQERHGKDDAQDVLGKWRAGVSLLLRRLEASISQ
jgi:hypothetical protein